MALLNVNDNIDGSLGASWSESGPVARNITGRRAIARGPAIGELLGGKYEIVDVIGEGGMGTVFRARSHVLDVDVAVKVLRSDCADGLAGQRLLREARAIARLRHPTIVRAFDFGETDTGEPYLVMELVEGVSLGRWIEERGRMPAIPAVRTLLRLADGVAAAHAQGIIHRDIKPGNILVVPGESGGVVPKLVDFGIAKVMLEGPRAEVLTQRGTILGSLEYMSPEQANGQEVSEQADVWSLSVVLYESITGQRPFVGTNLAAILLAVHTRAPVPTTALAAGDEELWAIIARGLEKSLPARWPSVAAFGRALAEWAIHRGVATDAGGSALSSRWLGESSDYLVDVSLVDSSRGQQPSLMSVLTGEALRSMELSLSATSIMPPAPVETAPPPAARLPGDVERPRPDAADSISPSACRAVPVRRTHASWIGALAAFAVAPFLLVAAVQGYRPWAAGALSAEATDRAGVLIDQASLAANDVPAPTPRPTPLPPPVDQASSAKSLPSASTVRLSRAGSGVRLKPPATAMPLPAAPSF